MTVAFKTDAMARTIADLHVKDVLEQYSEDISDGRLDEKCETCSPAAVQEDPKKLNHASTVSTKKQSLDLKEKTHEADKTSAMGESSNLEGLSKRQRKRLKEKKKNEEDGLKCDYTQRTATFMPVGCGAALQKAAPETPKLTRKKIKEQCLCTSSTTNPRDILTEKFKEVRLHLFVVVTTFPIALDAVHETLDHYARFCQLLEIRPFMQPFFDNITSFSIAHINLTQNSNCGDQDMCKFFSQFFKHVGLYLRMEAPDAASEDEDLVFRNLHAVIGVFIPKLLADVYHRVGQDRVRRLYLEWVKKRNAVLAAMDQESRNLVGSVERSMVWVSRGLMRVEAMMQVVLIAVLADANRFVYDGSYCDNDYQNFLDLYLNCNVLRVRGCSFYRRQHLLVADFTTGFRYLQYYGRVLEFWHDFERFKQSQKDDLKDQGANDSTASSAISLSWKYSQEDTNRGGSNSPLDQSDSEQNYLRGSLYEKLVFFYRNLNPGADVSFSQSQQSKIEHSDRKAAFDYPLGCVQQYFNAKSMLICIIVFLVFTQASWFFVFYYFDVLFWMLVFMYFCVYFVINF